MPLAGHGLRPTPLRRRAGRPHLKRDPLGCTTFMRQSFLGLALAFSVPWAACQAQQGTVPFVGCSADGQSGPIQPPKGQPKVVSLGQHPAGAIAYYKGEQAPGVFAPAGWHCRVWYGSSGSSILVTPTPIGTTHLVPPKVVAPAVEMGLRLAGTSGRFSVASYASRLFPKILARFIEGVKNQHLVPDSEFAPRRYARDSVSSVDSLVTEFTTPANVSGLGTEGLLGPSRDPIRGVAVIAPDPTEPDMSILRVRLGGNMRQVEGAVLRLNRECMQKTDGC